MPTDEIPNPISLSVIGEKTAIGPLRQDLAAIIASWLDPETLRTLGGISFLPWTPERVQDWMGQVGSASDECWFVAYTREPLRPIGIAGLNYLDYRDRTGEYNLVIGEKEARGKGFGTELTRLVLDYAFMVLGLHNVWLRVFEYNLAAIRVYEKAGFVHIGQRHASKLMGGKLWDTVMMECLADAFSSPVLGRLYRPDLHG